jgi:hypothetical protein
MKPDWLTKPLIEDLAKMKRLGHPVTVVEVAGPRGAYTVAAEMIDLEQRGLLTQVPHDSESLPLWVLCPLRLWLRSRRTGEALLVLSVPTWDAYEFTQVLAQVVSDTDLDEVYVDDRLSMAIVEAVAEYEEQLKSDPYG